MAAIGVCFVATIRDGHDWGDDFSQYILHARNLAQGRPYHLTGYLYNAAEPMAPVCYPPGFPLLLAPLFRLAGLNLTVLKLAGIACFVGALLLLHPLWKSRLPFPYPTLLVACVGLNPYCWEFKDQILSDYPFLLLSTLGLWLAESLLRQAHRGSRYWLLAVGLGVVLALAYATRTVGVVLVATVAVADVLQHRRITAGVVLAVGLACLWMVMQQWWQPSGPGYREQWHVNPKLLIANVGYYVEEVRDWWRNGYSGALMRGVFLVVNGLAIVGYVRALRRAIGVLELFGPLYVATIFAWPQYQGIRFLLPVIPLYLGYALAGLRWVGSTRQRFAWLPRAALAIVLLSYIGRYSTLRLGPVPDGITSPEAIALFEFLKRTSEPTDVLVGAKPRALALFAGRTASVYHQTSDEALVHYVDSIGARYVITSRLFFWDEQFLTPLIVRQSHRFELVYTNARFAVYRLRPTGPPAS